MRLFKRENGDHTMYIHFGVVHLHLCWVWTVWFICIYVHQSHDFISIYGVWDPSLDREMGSQGEHAHKVQRNRTHSSPRLIHNAYSSQDPSPSLPTPQLKYGILWIWTESLERYTYVQSKKK